MDSNLKTLFYLKKPKNYVSGEMPIYYRITLNLVPAELSTGISCIPSHWNKKTERIKESHLDSVRDNMVLSQLELRAKDNYRYISEMEPHRIMSSQDIKDILLGKQIKRIMLLDVFREHNEKVKGLIGQDFSAGTLQRYETSFKHTADFIKKKYKATDIAVTQVNHLFISDYDFYLRSVRGCNNNTTVKYIKNFKKIILICLASGYIVTNPFLNYKPKIKLVNRIALTLDELGLLEKKVFNIDRLDAVKDTFLFCCYTGLAYADVSSLKRGNILKGIDGEIWLHTFRQKTLIPTKVPLLDKALKLITKYKGHSKCSEQIFPLISNQKMNAYLKEIADICGIQKDLTFHIARHTFATTITLSNGVPIDTVSKMLGHTNIRTTQLYAKTLEQKISADMMLLKQKLQKKSD
jgi:integrase